MTFLADNRGQIRVIEAFFASVLLLSSLMLIPSDHRVANSNDETLRNVAQRTLIMLDGDGTLSRLIENQSWATLRKCVQSLLPSPATWFNLTILDDNMNPINLVQICSGTSISGSIVAAEYVCASSDTSFNVYIVRLQLSSVT
jgi:hypothetical protein